jgi:periplasmic protein TonB
VHALVVCLLIVAPLLATGALPMPSSGTAVILLETPPLPQPPAIRRVTPQPAAPVNLNAAPLVAPDVIAPEPQFDRTFEDAGTEIGIVGGSDIEGSATVVPPPPPVQPPTEMTVRAGGVVRQPERISYIAPMYPPLALQARVRGLVIIEATIDTEGRVRDARVLRSDSTLLNDAAIGAVRQWTYTPTLLNGVPVSVVMTVTVQFDLR